MTIYKRCSQSLHADTVLRLNMVSSAYIITSAKDNLYGHF